MSGNIQYAKEWLEKVEEDEFAARQIVRARRFRFLAPACFHFHQMAEKLLKALLVFYQGDFPKTHDLIALAAIIEHAVPDILKYKKDLQILNRYYIEARYPGDYPEISVAECKQAKKAADHFKKFVVAKIKTSQSALL